MPTEQPAETEQLAAGLCVYQKLLIDNELVGKRTVLYRTDSRSIPNRIVSLSQAHLRPLIRGKARVPFELGAKVSISVTDEGCTFLDRLSGEPYNGEVDLKVQTRAKRRHDRHF